MRFGSARTIVSSALLLFGVFGCAATQPSSDPWTIHYVGSPDDVWAAIHLALIDLDYDVESENRDEGVVRAVRGGDDQGSTEVLSIDQIMRGNEVKVYVRSAAGTGEPSMSPDRKEALATEFLALVNGLLYK
jgi:hypothetical protein